MLSRQYYPHQTRNLSFVLTAAFCFFCFIASSDVVRASVSATPITNDTIRIYVSPQGNDASSGLETAPLKTLEGARNNIRSIHKKNPGRPIIAYFKGGEYPVVQPVLFDQQDSGTPEAAVYYKAVMGEEPVFSGGKSLTKWKKLKDRTLEKLLNESARGKVYVTTLSEVGINDYGDPTQLGARPELFCNDSLQTLARWPNSGFVQTAAVKGKTPLPPTYIAAKGTKEGIAEYTDSYQDRWSAEKDVRLGGYWYWDWSEQFHKVERWNSSEKTFYIEPPYHHYGYKEGARYFGLNLFCEIDQPGEWYLDREKGQLYWYPPVGVNPSEADIRLSNFAGPFMLEFSNASHITLEGLTFTEGRGSAISVKDGENCLITDCRIQRFGRDGIHIDNGKNHGIRGSLLEHFGCGGIRIKGGDRANLVSSGHFIENTIVEQFSIFKRTYEPAVYLDGCGHRVSNSRFRFSSSSAFRLEGNDFLIEYNQVSQVVNESDDQGGIDIFYNPSYQGVVIRYNHWSDIHGGTKHGAAGVRLDDMISGVTIYGNIFEKAGAKEFGGVQIHGGKDNVVENNLFYQCPAAVSFSTWSKERWLEELDSPVIRKKIYEEVNIDSPLYLHRYSQLKNLRENPNVNRISRNAIVDCKATFIRDKGLQLQEANKVIESQGKPIASFLTPEFFKEQGMEPLPVERIGPKHNRWE